MKPSFKGAVLAALAGGIVLAGGGAAAADSGARGAAIGSPGVLSGNVVQVPIHIPVNACGNSLNVLGFLNPSFGNTCANLGHRGDHRHDDGKAHGGKRHHAGAVRAHGKSAGPHHAKSDHRK